MLNEMIAKLNPEQRDAVLCTQGPLLLLAGAGSGKTRVLTHRIAYLIEQGVKPYNILAITFTNKAAREMKERVCAVSPYGEAVWVSTFHSTCVRILRKHIDRLGYNGSFSIYDSDDSQRLIKTIIKERNLSENYYKPKAVAAMIGKQKDALISPEEYIREHEGQFRYVENGRIYAQYQEQLKTNNALDFGDLIYKTVELFRSCPDVLDEYQERFKYIMVDEYQDTNASQYELVRLLASKYNNLCVVGDDDQSIYGWRGADISNILGFEQDFKDTRVIKLEQNYRSTQVILDSANAVIHHNLQRKDKRLWTEQKQGDLIRFYQAKSDYNEAEFICDEINTAVRDGKSYQDFAILYRNNALSRIMEEKLMARNIPYRLFGGTRFYDRKEIRDAVGYLKLINNPNDDIALRRVINVPKRGIGDTTVERLAAFAIDNSISMFEAMRNSSAVNGISKATVTKLNDFVRLIEELILEDRRGASPVDIFNKTMELSGYMQALKDERTEESANRLDNLKELLNKISEYTNVADEASIGGLLEEISLVSDVDAYDGESDTVVLMTLHSSKGLEFDTVFIIGFENGIFPSGIALESGDYNAIEEERRLCYVGITRAKKTLYLTCARSRMQNGKMVANRPSKFLGEIPKEYVDTIHTVPPVANIAIDINTSRFAPKLNMVGNKAVNDRPAFSMPAPKDVVIDYEIGDRVKHLKFGVGTVLDMTNAGADYEVKVEFENVGIKRLMARLSRLKKV